MFSAPLTIMINFRNEIHKIVENMDPVNDRGVFSTTTCQQVKLLSSFFCHLSYMLNKDLSVTHNNLGYISELELQWRQGATLF